MSIERVETLIIGGGQSGLAMSHMLRQRERPHIVVERHRIAERWRSERWEGLRFQFPNWSVQLPGFSFPHADPDGFATKDEILEFITAYAQFIAAPVRCGVAVRALRRRAGAPGFVAETTVGSIEAANVVVATGPYQRPVIPDCCRPTARSFRCTPVVTENQLNFRRARFLWSAQAPPARRLPRSCFTPDAASASRSAGTGGCRGDTGGAT